MRDKKYVPMGWFCLVAGCLFLGGCSSNQSRSSVKDGYLLNIQRPGADLPKQLTCPVEVRSCKAAAVFSARNLVYRLSPVQYEMDRVNNLLVPLDKQLTEAIQKWFRPDQSPAPLESGGDRLIIEATLDELVGDFVNRVQPKAHAQVRFVVVLDGRQKRQTILDRVYSADVSMHTNPSAGQVVTAMSRSIEQILQQLETDLVKLQQDRPLPGSK